MGRGGAAPRGTLVKGGNRGIRFCGPGLMLLVFFALLALAGAEAAGSRPTGVEASGFVAERGHRKLPTSCTTAGVAACFENASDGDELELAAGTLSSWDGSSSNFQLTLISKYASIACSADGGACVWQGATRKGVVYIEDNGGTTTLKFLVIKDGDESSGNGGGLNVVSSNVGLILVAFIDNAAKHGGAINVDNDSCSVTLHGCSFSGNTASDSGPDVRNDEATVAIGGCPEGKSIRPSTLLQNH